MSFYYQQLYLFIYLFSKNKKKDRLDDFMFLWPSSETSMYLIIDSLTLWWSL